MQRNRQEVVEIVDILEPHGFVTSQVAVDDGDTFLVGSLAQHHAGRVAGQDVEEEEDERHHSQQNQDTIEEPFESVAQHFFKLKIES